MPNNLLAALPSLRLLLSLQLSGHRLPGLAVALHQLTGLTQLDCAATAEPLPPLSTLLSLTRLRKLGWEERRPAGVLQLDLQQLGLTQLDGWQIRTDLDIQPSTQVRRTVHGASCA